MTDAPSPADLLRAKLREGGLTLAWFAMGSIPLVELGARTGFDAAVIDLQHGLWDRMAAHVAVGALGSTPVLARTASYRYAAIGEALDSGATGVIAPLVESAAQAAETVAGARFPPHGQRSGGGVRPIGEGFASYWSRHGDPLVGVMIETAKGLENAAEIAVTPGVDFVFIGPGDLALSLETFPQVDGRHEQACNTILRACQAIGKPCGIFTPNAEAAIGRRRQGYRAVVAANDIDVVVSGFAAAAKALADDPA